MMTRVSYLWVLVSGQRAEMGDQFTEAQWLGSIPGRATTERVDEEGQEKGNVTV